MIPTDDSLRKAVTGSLKAFNRIRFEESFKIEAFRVNGNGIYFSGDYRWYNVINATAAEKTAVIAKSNYFITTLQSSTGFFYKLFNWKIAS